MNSNSIGSSDFGNRFSWFDFPDIGRYYLIESYIFRKSIYPPIEDLESWDLKKYSTI